MKGAAEIFAFLGAAAKSGRRAALVTLTDVLGSSSRSVGTHMAVCEDGSYLGSFSGGCVEAAIVAEAMESFSSGKAQLVRFGAGSPFIDIRLPCGGGIELLIAPDIQIGLVEDVTRMLRSRQPVRLGLSRSGAVTVERTSDIAQGWAGDVFHAVHEPDLKLIVIGHGEEALAMVRQATAFRCELLLLSPDRDVVARANATGCPTHLLTTPARSSALVADEHTAVVMLFHDHDWEEELLIQAIQSDAFYIGAMGSRRTHANRLSALENRGLPARLRGRVRGPIGLIPASRDPETLALSVMAEVVDLHRRVGPTRGQSSEECVAWFLATTL